MVIIHMLNSTIKKNSVMCFYIFPKKPAPLEINSPPPK